MPARRAPSHRTLARVAAAAFVGLVAVAGCTTSATDGPGASTTSRASSAPRASSVPPSSSPSADPSATTGPSPTAGRGDALTALAGLTVKGRAPMTGYDRGSFAYDEVDVDGDGCDTRNEILLRDLTEVVMRPAGCLVATGTLADPYSGRSIAFVRGVATSSDVQIDHVVALADAWQKGAQRWDDATRARFGNDPLNLLAVDGPLNQSKGAGDAATWLPPNKAFRCAYVARQVAVKAAYGLAVTSAERDAIARVLASCPDEPLPTADALDRDVELPRPTTPAPTPDEPAVDEPGADDPDVYYANCTAARAAGAAPLLLGDPGYRTGLDRDRDGVACE